MSDRVKEMVNYFLNGKPLKDCRPADNEWRTAEEVEGLFRVYFRDLTERLAALSEAVRALPVEDLVQTGPDGGPELVGYGMMAQGEWDRVKAALPPQEPTT